MRLTGSVDDWKALRARAEKLGSLMTDEVARWWLPCLLPVLDQFVAAYEGRVDPAFWQSMVKIRQHGAVS